MEKAGKVEQLIGKKLSKLECYELCISLAKKGLGDVSPNPPVGCVIVDSDHNLIGYGYHKKFGEVHAEVNAINSVKDMDALNGAHVYVSLEPCSHEGKTPACAKMLCEHPISSVSYGQKDSNPKVSGEGHAILEKSNIQTVVWNLSLREGLGYELDKLTECFFVNQSQGRSFISLKAASSLDGQVALKTRESKWITNEYSRNYGHGLRGQHDALLVGVGTLLSDDPSLNVRHKDYTGKAIKVVIIDPEGRALESFASLKINKVHEAKNIFYVGPQSEAIPEGVVCIEPAMRDGSVSLRALTELLFKQHQMGSIYVEGGAETYSHFINSGLVDRYHIFIGNKVIGSKGGLSWTQGVSISSLRDAHDLYHLESLTLSENIYITFRSYK